MAESTRRGREHVAWQRARGGTEGHELPGRWLHRSQHPASAAAPFHSPRLRWPPPPPPSHAPLPRVRGSGLSSEGASPHRCSLRHCSPRHLSPHRRSPHRRSPHCHSPLPLHLAHHPLAPPRLARLPASPLRQSSPPSSPSRPLHVRPPIAAASGGEQRQLVWTSPRLLQPAPPAPAGLRPWRHARLRGARSGELPFEM